MSEKLKKRKDISSEFKWHINDLCESDEKWNQLFDLALNEIKVVAEFKGKLKVLILKILRPYF